MPSSLASCLASIIHGRFVATERPFVTGPAIPKQACSTRRLCCVTNSRTISPRLPCSRLGNVPATTGRSDAASKKARLVLVPPISPARIMSFHSRCCEGRSAYCVFRIRQSQRRAGGAYFVSGKVKGRPVFAGYEIRTTLDLARTHPLPAITLDQLV